MILEVAEERRVSQSAFRVLGRDEFHRTFRSGHRRPDLKILTLMIVK